MIYPNNERIFLFFPVIFLFEMLFIPPICSMKLLFVPKVLKGVNRPFYVLHTLYHRKSNPRRKPLIWNGARQVGKTWGVA